MGRQVNNMARFQIGGKAAAKAFHYKMCGLDDVYLLNGFKIHKTSYGTGVSIENADELHRSIGLFLILKRKALSPKDVRFLRKEIDLTQGELAGYLGVTSQTVARYEKGETDIPGPVDRLLRLLFAYHLLPAAKRGRALAEVMKAQEALDDAAEAKEPVYFAPTAQGGWESRWAA
jgi:DNA-binding transcriptional regulator YiaG